MAGAMTHSPAGGGGGGNDYGSAAVMEELFGALELHRQEQAAQVGEELALLRQLHDGKLVNFSLLEDQRQALAELNATEEVNASVDITEASWNYANRGFTPIIVDDPQPQQARIMEAILENEEMWPESTLGTAASLFLQTYLIYWAYDANGDGNISAEEEGIEEMNLVGSLFGASTSLLSAWVNVSFPDDPFVKPLLLGIISGLDESDISWANIDVTGDGNDDVRSRLVPIIGNLIEQSDANPFDGDVQLGAEGGLSFEFEKCTQLTLEEGGCATWVEGVELDQPLEIAVIRGATYAGNNGEDLTYVWAVDTQFQDVPDTYDWEGTTDDFAIYLNASGINPGDLSSLNAPYNLRYHINANLSNSSDNGVEELTITPGYIKYNWSRGGTPEEPLPAMEEMSFVKLDISNPRGKIPAELELRIISDDEDGVDRDALELYAKLVERDDPLEQDASFNLDFQYYEYNVAPRDGSDPFLSHIIAELEGIPSCDRGLLPGEPFACLSDRPGTSLWLEVRNESTDEQNRTVVEFSSTQRLKSFVYGDYEYLSSTDAGAAWGEHDYRIFTGVLMQDLPQHVLLEGSFMLFDDDSLPPVQDLGNLVGDFLNNMMFALADKLVTIGRILRSIPQAVLGVTVGEGAGEVRLTMRTRSGDKAWLGKLEFWITSHAWLTLPAGDDYLTIYNETAWLAANSPAPGRAAISGENLDYSFSGRLTGIGDAYYNSSSSYRTVEISVQPDRDLPLRVYFEGIDTVGATTQWANITFSDIPTEISLNMQGGAMSYSGGPAGDPFGDRVMESITFTSQADGIYTRFELEHLPGDAEIAVDGNDMRLLTDSWFNFSFVITNQTADDVATAQVWDESLFDGNWVLLYRDRVGAPDELASLAGRLGWLQSLRLDSAGDMADFQIQHRQPTQFKVGAVDLTDYESPTAGLNAYVMVDPLPVNLTVRVPLLDASDLPAGVGNLSSLGDMARLIEALSDLGEAMVQLVSDLSLNLISNVESFETVARFIYSVEEEVAITAWIDKGNVSLLEGPPRWVQGLWSDQLDVGDEEVLAARLLLPGLPRLVDADYLSRGDELRLLLDLKQYNHEMSADYLFFREHGIFGPQFTAYIAAIPQSLDLVIDANLTINATVENFTLAGSIDFESSQPVGPIYIRVEEEGERPYSLEILLPQLPRDLSLELDIRADRMVLNLTASEAVDHVVFAAELGDTARLESEWVNGLSLVRSAEGDMSVKTYLRGISPQLSIEYRDRPDGTSLGLAATDFNAGGEMEELVAQVAGVDNKSLDLRLGDLPSNLDATALLVVDTDDAGDPVSANLTITTDQSLGTVYGRVTDTVREMDIEIALPELPESLSLGATLGDIVGVEFASLVSIPRVTLAADVGSVPEPAYWTHGAVLRQADDNVSLRFHLTGLPQAASLQLATGEPDVISLDLQGWSPERDWVWLDIDRGAAGTGLRLFLDGIPAGSDLVGTFSFGKNLAAGVDSDSVFDISASKGLGRAYFRSHNQTGRSVNEIILSEVPHELRAKVLVGREVRFNFHSSSGQELLMARSTSDRYGGWRTATALVHDVPAFFDIRIEPNYDFDMDLPFMFQGFPNVAVQASEPGLDVVLQLDPGYTGGHSGTWLDATDLGNNTRLYLDGYAYVIDAPNGIGEAFLRSTNSPATPQFTLHYLELHAAGVEHVRITPHELFGVYPVFELSEARGGELGLAIAGELRLGPLTLDTAAMLLDIRLREVGGLPLIPGWLEYQRGGLDTELGAGERHYILPEPGTSLFASLGASL
jgi:hypothetical protein